MESAENMKSKIMRIKRKHPLIEITLLTEWLYLLTVAFYIFKSFSQGTLFYFPWPQNYDIVLRFITCMIIFLKSGYSEKYAGKEWGICILSSTIWGLSWISTGYAFLLDTALLSMGAVGISYQKILKTGFWVGCYLMLLAMLGSCTGCIDDLVYSSEEQIRHAFGIAYPTDFAAHLAFLAITGWTVYGGYQVMLPVIGTLAISIFILYFAQAKCSTIVLLFLIVAILYVSLTERKTRQPAGLQSLIKKVDCALIYIMPVCALLMIGLTWFYNEELPVMTRINQFLNNRLSYGRTALDTYGVKLFGTAFDMVGAGGGMEKRWDYNFIDISYVMILVRYGFMVLSALAVQYVWTTRKALGANQRKLVFALALTAIHSMIEHHLPEYAFNFFLLLPFANIAPDTEQVLPSSPRTGAVIPRRHVIYRNQTTARPVIRKIISYLMISLTCILIFATLPISISYLKTIVDMLGLKNPENHLKYIGIVTVTLFASVSAIWLLGKVATTLAEKAAFPLKYCIGLIGSLLFSFILFLEGEHIIQNGCSYRELLNADRPVIEALLSKGAAVGRVYVDHIPEIYRREFGTVSGGIVSPEGATFYKDATILVNDHREFRPLIDTGFVYGEISPGRAVYTNSNLAKTILEEQGIVLTSFYSKRKTLDLNMLAEKNQLEMTNDGTLLLNGTGQSLRHGPGESIYRGWLRVEYKLRLLKGNTDNNIAATAQVTSSWGQILWKEQDILLTDFDEQGNYTCSFRVGLSYHSSGIEFLLFVPDGVELELLEIQYGKEQ